MANISIVIYDVDTMGEVLAVLNKVTQDMNSNVTLELPHNNLGYMFKSDEGKIIATINQEVF